MFHSLSHAILQLVLLLGLLLSMLVIKSQKKHLHKQTLHFDVRGINITCPRTTIPIKFN